MTTDYTNIGTLATPIAQSRQLPPVKTANTGNKSDNVVRIDFQRRQEAAEGSKAEAAKKEISDASNEAVVELNNSKQVVSRNLEFHIDDDSGKTVITVRDSQSQKVIRQIPSDQLLEISSKLKDLQESNTDTNSAKGILFTSKT